MRAKAITVVKTLISQFLRSLKFLQEYQNNEIKFSKRSLYFRITYKLNHTLKSSKAYKHY